MAVLTKTWFCRPVKLRQFFFGVDSQYLSCAISYYFFELTRVSSACASMWLHNAVMGRLSSDFLSCCQGQDSTRRKRVVIKRKEDRVKYFELMRKYSSEKYSFKKKAKVWLFDWFWETVFQFQKCPKTNVNRTCLMHGSLMLKIKIFSSIKTQILRMGNYLASSVWKSLTRRWPSRFLTI